MSNAELYEDMLGYDDPDYGSTTVTKKAVPTPKSGIAKENTYIVIKREDALKYLTEVEYCALEKILNTISDGRSKDGKNACNHYYVCNTNEPYAEVVHGIIIGGEAVKEQNLSTGQKKLVTSDEDCADCLCRVCARNRCNDSYNHISEEDGRSCECNCKIGDKLIETEDDCPDFLPDEDD